jgi:hypothetical protein
MAEPADTDWAYAAGFVDGCSAIVRSFKPSRGRCYYGVHVVVANGNRDVFDWMNQPRPRSSTMSTIACIISTIS